MTFSSLLFIAMLLLGGMLLIRYARQEPPAGPRSPEKILAERYASGELTEEEYRQQLATLRDTGVLTR